MDTALRGTKLNDIMAMLSMLNDTELNAVNSVVTAFITNKPGDNPYKPMTEEMLFEDIDEGISEADQGMQEDALGISQVLRSELQL